MRAMEIAHIWSIHKRVFFFKSSAKIIQKKAEVKTSAKSMRKTEKSIAFLGQKGLNIDRDRMKRTRIVEQGTDVGNGEPSFFTGCWVVRSYAPRVQQLLKEIGGVLFTKVFVQATVHLVEGNFVFRIHTIRILDVFR